MAYKEAKENVKWKNEIREREVKRRFALVNKALDYFGKDTFEELAENVFSNNKDDVGEMTNWLMIQGEILLNLENGTEAFKDSVIETYEFV